jgi:hypothetical protein
MAQGLQYNSEIAATSSGTNSVAFGFNALKVVVINDGSARVYIDLTTTSGSTTGHRMASGESVSITAKGNAYYTGLSCAATSSATVRVLALR